MTDEILGIFGTPNAELKLGNVCGCWYGTSCGEYFGGAVMVGVYPVEEGVLYERPVLYVGVMLTPE